MVYRTTRVVITGDTLKILGDHVVGDAFQYKLNPAATPPMIDLLSGGGAVLGIYELRGNRLRICTDEAPGRPKEFWAELGSSKDLLVLERVGDAAVEPDEKTIQGTWEVVDCTTAETPPVYASALMDIYAILYKGQSVTITRHTIGPRTRAIATVRPHRISTRAAWVAWAAWVAAWAASASRAAWTP